MLCLLQSYAFCCAHNIIRNTHARAQAGRQARTHAGRQARRQAGTQAGRQAETETETETGTETETDLLCGGHGHRQPVQAVVEDLTVKPAPHHLLRTLRFNTDS